MKLWLKSGSMTEVVFGQNVRLPRNLPKNWGLWAMPDCFFCEATKKSVIQSPACVAAIRPSIGLLADAYSFFGIRPAKKASRPASHA